MKTIYFMEFEINQLGMLINDKLVKLHDEILDIQRKLDYEDMLISVRETLDTRLSFLAYQYDFLNSLVEKFIND